MLDPSDLPCLQLLGLLIVTESPRWLVSKARREAVLQVLAKYHANCDISDPLVQFEFCELCAAIQHEESVSEKGWVQFRHPRRDPSYSDLCPDWIYDSMGRQRYVMSFLA
jgi:hypothetical protein